MSCKTIDRYLDPGIRETVRWLRSLGFATYDSGDGVSKPDIGRNHDVPHVFIQIDPARLMIEADNLARYLTDRGIVVKAHGTDYSMPSIYGTFDPIANTATIALIGVNDAMLKRHPRRSTGGIDVGKKARE